MAIRGALGASRSRIVRQLLTESVLLALGGALIGLLLAQAGLDVLRTVSLKQIHFSVPFFAEIEVDGGVLLFTVGLAVVTGLLFGIVPAWHATRTNLAESLKESGRSIGGTRRHHRILGGLVVSQIGLSVVLLVAAALLVQSLFQLTRVSPGFNTVRLLTLETELSSRRYTNQTQRLQFYDQVLERVRALPNVRSADVVNLLPLTGLSSDWSFDIEGAEPLPPGRMRLAEYRVISPDYFSTMGIPVKQGRAFEPTDLGHGRKVAVVNETLVKRYLTHMNPLGRRLNFDGETNWIEVVGVVGDVKHFTLKEEARPMIYQPIAQDCWHRMSVVARTAGEPLAVARAVQEAVWQVAPDQPVARVRPMEVWLAESVSVERFSAWLLLSIASIGLLLAAIGLYGVLSYVMGQRTHEIGVRMALGAQVADVLGLVMRQGIKLAAIGLVAGFLAALAVGRAIHGLLYQMSVTDPLTYVLVLVVLALTALLACWFPARRAAKVDPMEALRYE
jgi:putative ABC transport system permease protein